MPILDEREAPIAQPILNDEKETPATPQAEPELVSSQKTEQSKAIDKNNGNALAAIPKPSDEINASKIESPIQTETQPELKILPADAKIKSQRRIKKLPLLIRATSLLKSKKTQMTSLFLMKKQQRFHRLSSLQITKAFGS